MRRFILVIVLFTQAMFCVAADADKGSLCAAAMPGGGSQRLPNMAAANSYFSPTDSLLVQVGQTKSMSVSAAAGGKIDGLPLDERHLVQIKRDGITRVSFWFDFREEQSTTLCLWYYSGYGTFSLLDNSDKRCRCEP